MLPKARETIRSRGFTQAHLHKLRTLGGRVDAALRTRSAARCVAMLQGPTDVAEAASKLPNIHCVGRDCVPLLAPKVPDNWGTMVSNLR